MSLSGGFGEVRLGRDYTPTFMNGLGDEFGIVGIGSRGIFLYGAGSNLGSVASTVLRADNAISYLLPAMGGVYGQIQVAPSEGIVGNRYTGGGLGYKNSAMDVGVAYGVTDVGTPSDFKHYNVKFNYMFGFATLHTLYDVKTWGDRKTQDISIGASVPVATGTIRVGYTRANRSGGPVGSGYADGDDSTRLAIGYVHDLSKRTALYTTYSRISNDGAARSSVLGTPPAGMLGGENSSGFEVGLRHTF